ncbi:MAG: pentapeptide repeat-containing protein, partial [Cyanobacteria bacterium J06649_11]
LSGADLSGADLSGANLRQANLTDANLVGAILSNADVCRCDLTGANLRGATLTNTYLRGADCKNAMFNSAILEGSDFCRAYLYNTDFSDATFFKTSVRKANIFSANFERADFNNLIWDSGTSWLHSKGLHKVRNIPDSLGQNLDFKDSYELSRAYEMLDANRMLEAISMCKKVAKNIVDRHKDIRLKASIYNRFAWLCSLLHTNDRCKGKILALATEAVRIDKKSGNYKDTLAIINIIFYPNFYIPQPFEEQDDEKAKENPYQTSIDLLNQALNCEDFKKLALPNMREIRQRRKNWIKSLELRINPLSSKEVSLLLEEEY